MRYIALKYLDHDKFISELILVTAILCFIYMTISPLSFIITQKYLGNIPIEN